MIYKEHKLLFSAIPKTGTTTISSYINKFFNYEQIKIPSITLKKTNKTNHKKYTEYYNRNTPKIISVLYDMDFNYFRYAQDI